MSSIAHRYADFSPLDPDEAYSSGESNERVENQKLEAFEEGYQAGWTDADKNHTSEQKSIDEEFLHSLRDLSFSYHEALTSLNRSLKPMFEQLIKTLLPQTTSAALCAHVIEQLMQLAATQTEGEISLRVANSSLQMLEDLLCDAELNFPINIIADETLTPHQLFLALNTTEREINLDVVCQEIATAMKAFNFHTQPERIDA